MCGCGAGRRFRRCGRDDGGDGEAEEEQPGEGGARGGVGVGAEALEHLWMDGRMDGLLLWKGSEEVISFGRRHFLPRRWAQHVSSGPFLPSA